MNTSLSPVAVDTLYVERLRLWDFAQCVVRGASESLVRSFGRQVCVKTSQGFKEWITVHPDTDLSPASPLDSGDGYDALTPNEVVAEFAAGHPKASGLAEQVARYEDAVSGLADALLAVSEAEAEYESRPWARYWLVTSSDGHIHASTRCCTCNKGKHATGFALVPYLSGSTPADAVADLGPALCSVCFPEAPVESKEVSTIPARLALALREEGSEAFLKARQEASEKAKAKAADRCPGSGERAAIGQYGYVKCPSCGWSCRSSTGKVAAHRRPRFYAVQRVEYGNDKFWTGTGWGPSTKKVAFESREAALAIEGATEARKD